MLNTHDLARLLLEWPNGGVIIEHEDKCYETIDIEYDSNENVHLVTRG